MRFDIAVPLCCRICEERALLFPSCPRRPKGPSRGTGRQADLEPGHGSVKSYAAREDRANGWGLGGKGRKVNQLLVIPDETQRRSGIAGREWRCILNPIPDRLRRPG